MDPVASSAHRCARPQVRILVTGEPQIALYEFETSKYFKGTTAPAIGVSLSVGAQDSPQSSHAPLAGPWTDRVEI
jgi:hypothetical protein